MSFFERRWRERFEEFGRIHEADHQVSGWSAHGLRRRLRVFAALLKRLDVPSPSLALDVGCGAGTYVRFLENQGHRVIGLDYSSASLSRALEADSNKVGRYVRGEAYRLPFRDRSFALVLAVGLLQSLDAPERALDEMVRVLRPGGFLAIEFLNALDPVSLYRALDEHLGGHSRRNRYYSPVRVRTWLGERGLTSLRKAGVFMTPPRFGWLEKAFDEPGVAAVLDGIPGLSFMGAHAFFVAGRKDGD